MGNGRCQFPTALRRGLECRNSLLEATVDQGAVLPTWEPWLMQRGHPDETSTTLMITNDMPLISLKVYDMTHV